MNNWTKSWTSPWFRCVCVPLHPAEWDSLKKVFPELDTKKDLEAAIKFLDSLWKRICWWLAWLEHFVEVLLLANLWYWVTKCCLRFHPMHGTFHEAFSTCWECFLTSLTEITLKALSRYFILVCYVDTRTIGWVSVLDATFSALE